MLKKNINNSYKIKDVCKFLKTHNDFCILTHASPDGDTLGSAAALYMGLKNAGKNCFIVCGDNIPEKYSYFFDNEFLKPIDYKTVIAVDIADEHLLGSAYEEFNSVVDLCIDHHISNTGYAKNLYLDSCAAATCESIYDIIKAMKWKLNDKMAAALYTGLSTDTGSFKYANVTAKTHKIAADLYNYNIRAYEISKIMFDTKSKALLNLEKLILESAQFFFNDRCFVLSVTTDMLKSTGCNENELESVAAISRCVEGVIVGVSIKQKDNDTFKVSLRTYDPLNASEICKRLGGGGHRAAAGCTLNGSLEEVKQQVLCVIEKALEESDAGISAC